MSDHSTQQAISIISRVLFMGEGGGGAAPEEEEEVECENVSRGVEQEEEG